VAGCDSSFPTLMVATPSGWGGFVPGKTQDRYEFTKALAREEHINVLLTRHATVKCVCGEAWEHARQVFSDAHIEAAKDKFFTGLALKPPMPLGNGRRLGALDEETRYTSGRCSKVDCPSSFPTLRVSLRAPGTDETWLGRVTGKTGGRFPYEVTFKCAGCDGTGKRHGSICRFCDGTGDQPHIIAEEHLTVIKQTLDTFKCIKCDAPWYSTEDCYNQFWDPAKDIKTFWSRYGFYADVHIERLQEIKNKLLKEDVSIFFVDDELSIFFSNLKKSVRKSNRAMQYLQERFAHNAIKMNMDYRKKECDESCSVCSYNRIQEAMMERQAASRAAKPTYSFGKLN